MLFNSDQFIFIFLPCVLLGFFLLKNYAGAVSAQIWLTLSSIVFYGLSGWRFVPVLLISMAFNFIVGRALALRHTQGSPNRYLLLAGVGLDLMLLAYFKYADFISSNLHILTGRSVALGRIELPVGISFYTFTQIAYLVDAARGEAKEYDLKRYALFVTFFPHLIAGPIIHHKEMMPQFTPANLHRRIFDFFPLALTLFVIGLAKKVILADSFARYSSPLFEAALKGTPLDLIEGWSAALCYTFQIYFDFSGYSDMALGLALMFGIRLPVNFFSPYKSESIIEFWRRWHMTLSRFLRDYLYFPLGGNRKGSVRRYLNLFVVMCLGGLWHGAGWTFVLWGALHGVYLMLNHFWRFLTDRKFVFSIRPSVARLLTFIAVVFAWVIFRADNLNAAMRVYQGMLGWNGASIADDALGLLSVHHAVHIFGFEIRPLFFNQDQQWQAALMIVLGLVVVWRLPSSMEIARIEPRARFVPVRAWCARLRFSPSVRFALATGFGFFLCIAAINASAVSEFIYFKF